MPGEFKDRHLVVTGGGGALGAAVVSALVERGAICHLPVRGAKPPDSGRERVEVRTGIDLTDEASVSAFYAGLPALWGSVHVAGGFAMAPIVHTGLDHLERMLRINAVTCFLCCREAVRTLRERGEGGGRIVNVAARPAVQPTGGMVAYSASKAAVASITQSLAAEVADHGILVNAVLPSIMDTAQNRQAMPGADFDTWPKVEEVAEVIADLASPRNRVTSGALLPVYGRA